MPTFFIALASALAFWLAYRTYGRCLGRRVFRLSAERICPSVRFLVVSLRNNGRTVGDIAGRMLNRRVRVPVKSA